MSTLNCKGFNITVSNYSFTLIGDASLTSNNERPCPDDIIVFSCNVSGVDLFWQILSSEGVLVAQFNIDFQTMVNTPEEMIGFTATLRSRTTTTDSTSTLTTTASVEINWYTVVCASAAMEIGRMTIQLSDSSEFNLSKEYMIIKVLRKRSLFYFNIFFKHSCRSTRNNSCFFKSAEFC